MLNEEWHYINSLLILVDDIRTYFLLFFFSRFVKFIYSIKTENERKCAREREKSLTRFSPSFFSVLFHAEWFHQTIPFSSPAFWGRNFSLPLNWALKISRRELIEFKIFCQFKFLSLVYELVKFELTPKSRKHSWWLTNCFLFF